MTVLGKLLCTDFSMVMWRVALHLALLLSSFEQESAVHNGLGNTFSFSHCGMSTSASPEKEQGTPVENKGANGNVEGANQAETSAADASLSAETQQTGATSESPSASQSVKRRRQGTKRTAFSDSDSEGDLDDLSRDDLVKLVSEKEQVLQQKEKDFAEWKDKFLRSYAEMENVMERTRRDAENSKKFAIQVCSSCLHMILYHSLILNIDFISLWF